jgi:hypothetical protein
VEAPLRTSFFGFWDQTAERSFRCSRRDELDANELSFSARLLLEQLGIEIEVEVGRRPDGLID